MAPRWLRRGADALLHLPVAIPSVVVGLGLLWRVRLPAMSAAAALAVALSMGEVGATIMVYPPAWRTLPVTVFTLTDRGRTFDAAAATLILLGSTLVALLALGRISRGRAVAGGSP